MLYLSAKVTLLFAFRYFFIIYFYICSVNTDCVKDMQTLLNDIELDIQELKCLMQAISSDANPTLKIVAKRNIQQMYSFLRWTSAAMEFWKTGAGPPRPSAASGPSTLGRHSWTVIATAAELVCTRKASGTAGGFPLPFRTEGRSQLPARRQISWRLGPVETMVMGASMCFSMKST